MDNFIYKGTIRPKKEIKNSITKLSKDLTNDIYAINNIDSIDILNAFNNIYENTNNNYSSYLKYNSLMDKIKQDLGNFSANVNNTWNNPQCFQGFLPIGTVAHIVMKDNFYSFVIAITDSLITKNKTICLASDNIADGAFNFLNSLCEIEPRLADYIFFYSLGDLLEEDKKNILSYCDIVNVIGDNSDVFDINKLTSNPIIPHNDYVNISYVTKKGENPNTHKLLAKDYLSNSYGYYNPKIIYYECDTKKELLTFSEKVSAAITSLKSDIVPDSISDTFTSELPLIDLGLNSNLVITCNKEPYRIIVDTSDKLNITNDYNTLIIKKISRKNLTKILENNSHLINAVAIDALLDEFLELTNTFSNYDILSFYNIGEIYKNYSNDSLLNYVKPIKINNKAIPFGLSSLNNLLEPSANYFDSHKTIKVNNIYDILNLETSEDKLNKLLLSGYDKELDKLAIILPKENYFTNYVNTSNVFSQINVKPFIIAETNDFNYILKSIFENECNSIIGNSSYIYNLLFSNTDWVNYYGRLDKIFYKDEMLTYNEITALNNQLNISYVKSLDTLSINALNYPCNIYRPNYPNSNIKILKFDSNKNVNNNEIGRVIYNFKKNGLTYEYESGELGKWSNYDNNIKCYELVGTKGDLFKFNNLYFNYNDIKDVLVKELNYQGILQILLEKIDGIASFTILLEHNCNTTDAYYTLREFISNINSLEESAPATIKIYNLDCSEFSYHRGKAIHVINNL